MAALHEQVTAHHEQTAIPPLAAELTDMIIDFLHDDKPSLRSCALVARRWLDASQYHLFRSVRLAGVASPYGVDAFVRLLARAPRVAAYVRALDVLGERWYSFHQQTQAACLRAEHLAALAALPFLRRLTLTSVVWDGRRAAPAPAPAPLPPRALESLTLSHFTSFGDGAASLADVQAVVAPFAEIASLHLLRTAVRLAPLPGVPSPLPLQASAAVRLRAISLGPVSRTSTLYAALARLRLCAAVQSLKIEMGDRAEVAELAQFMRDAAPGVTRLELDVSSCRSIWVDLDPELMEDDIDWFRDLRLAEDMPLLSFRLALRGDPPSVFWSMVLSAVSALPATVRDINVVAADIMPNGFNDLVRLSSWQQLADGLRRLKGLQRLRVTFAGMDDFRLAQHARATFFEKVDAALHQREELFSGSKIAVAFRFVPELDRLA